ncbi:MAG: M28 family peptidase [Dehalococcoidia bacterium]
MSARLRLLALLSIPLLFAAACTADDTPAVPSATAEATRAPEATATPVPAVAVPAGALEPDGDRIKSIVSQLAVNIGTRPAGTASEEEGANLIAGLLRAAGYNVEIQPFQVSREVSREAKLSVLGSNARTISSNPLSSSAATTASGRLVAAGIGKPEEIPSNARGNILLIERGDLQFQQKVTNAQDAGAAGVIIFNNTGGNFFGTLSSRSSIPAISVSQADGRALLDGLNASTRVEISVGEAPITSSQNVVAKPPGKECETITGGHYDSVPAGPGANDNASGSATVVEIATVLASKGEMGSNCFILFGGEELGLLGSRAYVNAMSEADKQRLKAMLNFDMVGFGSEPWYLIGTPAMQTRAADIARGLGIATQTRGIASTGGGSDHASFTDAGMPAVFFYRANDPEWHQPGDTADRIDPALLEEAARMGIAMLEQLNEG